MNKNFNQTHHFNNNRMEIGQNDQIEAQMQ